MNMKPVWTRLARTSTRRRTWNLPIYYKHVKRSSSSSWVLPRNEETVKELNQEESKPVWNDARVYRRWGRRAHKSNFFEAAQESIRGSRQVQLRIQDLGTVQKKDVTNALAHFRPSPEQWRLHFADKRIAVVILATPQVASWLEPEANFIHHILKSISRSSEKENQWPLELDVVCGVVDGLSPSYNYIADARGMETQEGFALLFGSTRYILPNLLSGEETDVPSTEKPASITFQYAQPGVMDITLPMSNTLFINGRISTLLTSRWQSKDGVMTQIKETMGRSNLIINASGGMDDSTFESLIPAVPLTLARPIVSGLGNIVKKISHQGLEDPIAASAELETQVTKFLAASKYDMKSTKVWALIIPENVVEKDSTMTESKIRLPMTKFTPVEDPRDYKDIGYWISRGATFCQVLSGGGGWGEKAGLLSLDPQKTYTTATSEAWLEDNLAISNDDVSFPSSAQQITALGNIAKAGSYIQFYATQPRKERHGSNVDEAQSINPWRRSLVIGNIPSSIDKMPKPPSPVRRIDLDTVDILPPKAANYKPLIGETGLYRAVHIRAGRFGFVSEGGIFMKHKTYLTKGEDCETKIDMPYSFIYKTYRTKRNKREVGQRGRENSVKLYSGKMNHLLCHCKKDGFACACLGHGLWG